MKQSIQDNQIKLKSDGYLYFNGRVVAKAVENRRSELAIALKENITQANAAGKEEGRRQWEKELTDLCLGVEGESWGILSCPDFDPKKSHECAKEHLAVLKKFIKKLMAQAYKGDERRMKLREK